MAMSVRRRRAQLDVQFNWIFVLIAGGVILALFFKVAATQKQLSEDKAAVRLMGDFGAITTSALQSKDTLQRIDLPSQGLKFDCRDCACAIQFGRVASLAFGDRVIFTPNKITGDDARLWTLDWRVPFRATNLLYITNDFVKYFIIGDEQDPFMQRIIKKLPKTTDFNYEIMDTGTSDVTAALSAIRGMDQNYKRVVLVFIGAGTAPRTSGAYTAVKSGFRGAETRSIEFDDTTHTVAFINTKSGQSEVSAYLEDELLFGAIVAQDSEAYKCNARTAFMRLEGVAKVYRQRADALSKLPRVLARPDDCLPIYNKILVGETGHPAPLDTIIAKSNEIVANEPNVHQLPLAPEQSACE